MPSDDRKKQLVLAAVGVLGLSAVGYFVANSMHEPDQVAVTESAHSLDRSDSKSDSKNDSKSLSQWTEAIEKTPDDAKLYYCRGRLHSARGERSQAIDDFTRALTLKPDFLEVYQQRAVEYALTAQYEKGMADAEKLLALAPGGASGYETRAAVESVREQYAEAIADGRKAVGIEDNPHYYYLLASDYMKLAYYRNSSPAAQYMVSMSDSGEYSSLAGVNSAFQEKYDLARNQINHAVNKPGASAVEYAELAFIALCTGEKEKAQTAIGRAKRLEPSRARAFRLSGDYYRMAGECEKAVKEFSSSISLEEYPPAYRQRAVTYINLGQWRPAYKDLLKAHQLNPLSSLTLSYLARAEKHLNMSAWSDHMDKAFATKTLEPMNYVNRADVQLELGKKEEALKDADQAIRRDPFLKEGYEIRAQIRSQMNDTAGAAHDTGKAAKLISHIDL